MATTTEVAEGARVVVDPNSSLPPSSRKTMARGTSDQPPGPKPLDGRNRIDLRTTFTTGNSAAQIDTGSIVSTSVEGFGGGLDYYRWLKEDLALAISFSGRAASVRDSVGIGGVTSETTAIASFLVGCGGIPGAGRGPVCART